MISLRLSDTHFGETIPDGWCLGDCARQIIGASLSEAGYVYPRIDNGEHRRDVISAWYRALKTTSLWQSKPDRIVAEADNLFLWGTLRHLCERDWHHVIGSARYSYVSHWHDIAGDLSQCVETLAVEIIRRKYGSTPMQIVATPKRALASAPLEISREYLLCSVSDRLTDVARSVELWELVSDT
jgi:hypothetical protein